jgi:hypothetical protein
MSGPLKSFADIPRDAVKMKPRPRVGWDPRALENLSVNILHGATEALRTWLDARLADLRREGVDPDVIQIAHRGGRTLIRVEGVDRFEFKLKFTMEVL